MVYKKENMGGYNLHLIKTDKFKQVHLEIIFRNNIKKDIITKRNLLFDYLLECSSNYKTKRELEIKLEDLYNASVYTTTNRVGASIVTNVCLDFINPLLTERKVLEAAIKLVFELILNPLVNNEEFDDKILNLLKVRLKDEINSIKENPKKHALSEASNALGNTFSSLSSIGYVEDIEEITKENLYQYYKDVLNNDYIDVYLVGDIDMDEAKTYIYKYANFNIIKNHLVSFYVDNPKLKEKAVSKKTNYVQTSLVAVLNLCNLNSYERKYVAFIYNLILGGSSLESKLYKRLRSDNSLCYNVNSYYQKYDGLIYIATAVDVKEKENAISLIKSTLKDMVNNVSESELSSAKSFIQTSLIMTMDSLNKIVDNKFFEDVSDLDDWETRIKMFKSVTLEDVVNLAKKVSLGLIYTLEGGFNEED